MLFIPLRHNTSRPFYPLPPQKSLHLITFGSQLLKKSRVFVIFAIDSLLKQVELLEQSIISLCCENSEEASKGPRLSNYLGQMFFFSPMLLASELRSPQLNTPLTILLFLWGGGKDAMADSTERSGL